MCIKHHTHCSVESVTERGTSDPSLSSMCGTGRRVVDAWTSHVSVQGIEVEGTFRYGLKHFPHRWPRLLDTGCVFTLCVVRKRSVIWSTTQSFELFEPQPETGISTRSGIWDPTDVVKKVCQRLSDQDSSLWWVLICPSQLIGLNHKTRLGASSSWDSRLVTSVRRTESLHRCQWCDDVISSSSVTFLMIFLQPNNKKARDKRENVTI